MQDEKSQIQNRARAMQVLRARLLKLEQDRVAAEQSEQRRSQVGGGGRSEKIRTYNFKENRVTDHRIRLTLHKLDRVLEGDLDEIVDALIADERERGMAPAARADRRRHRARRCRRRSPSATCWARPPTPRVPPEARWVVAHATRIGCRSLVGRRLGAPVSGRGARRGAASMSARRLGREPLQYVLGTWAFRTLELHVDRPGAHPPSRDRAGRGVRARRAGRPSRGARSRRRGLVAADLGTGTGAIALSLACESTRRDADALVVWATDRSPEALELLELNRELLATTDPVAARRVQVGRGLRGSTPLPAGLAGHVALVVSNPPYVSAEEWAHLDAVVRDHEPKEALVPGPSGFEAIDVLLSEAPRWLVPGGSLVVELAPAQADRAAGRAEALGYVESAGVRRSRRAPACPRGADALVMSGTSRREPAHPGDLSAAQRALEGGGVVGIPTDTVYGLAADPTRPGATAAVFALKARPVGLDLPLLVASLEQADAIAGPDGLSGPARRLADAFWPGAAHDRRAPARRDRLGARRQRAHRRSPPARPPRAPGLVRRRRTPRHHERQRAR